jgi:pyruvate dehydrogenase E1 component
MDRLSDEEQAIVETVRNFRLSTKPVDQTLTAVLEDPDGRRRRRCQVLAGGYPLRRVPGPPELVLVGVGSVMPEVLAAADELGRSGVATDVVCLTSPDLVFRAMRARRGFGDAPDGVLADLFPPERAAPVVTVVDGHPHTLAFLTGITGTPVTTLGVDDFGQAGDVGDLYRHFGIDVAGIAGAGWDLLEERGARP